MNYLKISFKLSFRLFITYFANKYSVINYKKTKSFPKFTP